MCEYCASVMSVNTDAWCLGRSEEDVWSTANGHERPCRRWESNPGPLRVTGSLHH